MAGSGVSAGHDTRLYSRWEDSGFASSPNDNTNKALGWNVQMTTAEGSNALQRVFMPGKRTALKQLAMIFEGSFSVQFTLADPWWLQALLGSPNSSGSGPTYTHEFNDTDPDSFQLRVGHVESGKERVLKGCVATRATIDVSVEEEAQITLEGAYADEEVVDPGGLPSQPTPEYDPITFAEGSVKVGGTTESYVQSMTLTLEANVDMIREMGSRFPIDFNEKVLAPDVDFTKLYDGDEDSLESFYGGSSSAQEDADENEVGLDMVFDNGKSSGSGQNKIDLSVTGTLTDTYGESGIGDPRADLEESISRGGKDVNVTATNETETAP